MNYLELYRSAYITYICLHQSPKVLGIANKEAGWTPFTVLLVGLHHRINFGFAYQRRGFTKKGI